MYWLPYLAYLLSAGGFALYMSATHPRRAVMGGIALLVALALLALYIYRTCRTPRPHERRVYLVSLGVSLLLCTVVLAIAERLLPAPPRLYTKTQQALQTQLARRQTTSQRTFRGVTLQAAYNGLGWADGPRTYPPARPPIVFIGDSFLEVRSSRTVARLTQDLLQQHGRDLEVFNLSQAATGLAQYRHRFYEFALALQPTHIFLFVYEGNDLSPQYRYTPYRHPTFRLTSEALAVLLTLPLPPEGLNRLRQLQRSATRFDTRQALFRALQGIEMTPEHRELIYMAAYAYAFRNVRTSPVLPRFVAAVSAATRQLRRAGSPPPDPAKKPSWQSIYPQYKAIFQAPRSTWNDAMARFICQEYLRRSDAIACRQVLTRQEPRFQSYLLEADMIYYLLPAVEAAVRGSETVLAARQRDTQQAIETAAEAYVRLFDALQRTANSNNALLTLVLIPEASYGDADFRQFWLPLLDFQAYFATQHALYTAIKTRLTGRVPVIDLAECAAELHGGYWKFDGHWNEHGNRQVAALMARYLSHQSPPPAQETPPRLCSQALPER